MIIDTSFADDTLTIIADDENRIHNIYYDYGLHKKGDIYSAILVYIDHSLKAVFVNFGAKKYGFLAIDNIHPMYFGYKERDLKHILDKQIFMIQIEKEEYGTKGAYCTTYITLTGRYSVLLIDSKTIIQGSSGISKKINDIEMRRDLKDLFSNMKLPEDISVIFRSAVQEANKEDITQDIKMLIKTWNSLKRLKLYKMELLYSEARGIIKALRDYGVNDIKHVKVMNEDILTDAKRLIKIFYKNVNVDLYDTKDRALIYGEEIDRALYNMACDKVVLQSGGYICIAPTEALTAIDINSGKLSHHSAKKSLDADLDHTTQQIKKSVYTKTAFDINKEAAIESVKQILTRNIAGQIVIDFIEMDNIEKEAEIEKIIKDAFKMDKARVKIGKLSKFSMIEISRQRIGPSIYDWLLQKCQYCVCAGYAWNERFFARKHLRSVLYKMLDKQLLSNSHGNTELTKACTLYIHPNLFTYIMKTYQEYIKFIKQYIGVHVNVKSNHDIPINKCEIK